MRAQPAPAGLDLDAAAVEGRLVPGRVAAGGPRIHLNGRKIQRLWRNFGVREYIGGRPRIHANPRRIRAAAAIRDCVLYQGFWRAKRASRSGILRAEGARLASGAYRPGEHPLPNMANLKKLRQSHQARVKITKRLLELRNRCNWQLTPNGGYASRCSIDNIPIGRFVVLAGDPPFHELIPRKRHELAVGSQGTVRARHPR